MFSVFCEENLSPKVRQNLKLHWDFCGVFLFQKGSIAKETNNILLD